jgi:hypothetical protein
VPPIIGSRQNPSVFAADHRLAVVLSTCRAVALAKADHPRSIFSFLIFNFSFSLSPIAVALSSIASAKEDQRPP